MIYAQSKQIKYHNTMMKRHTYGKARNGNENGNWKLETGNWKKNWKQKWKCNLLAVVALVKFMYCWLLFLAPASVFDLLALLV